MQVTLRQFGHLSLSILMCFGLFACSGSSDSSSDATSDDVNPGMMEGGNATDGNNTADGGNSTDSSDAADGESSTDNNDAADGESSTGTGGCVNIAQPEVGLKIKHNISGDSEIEFDVDVKVERLITAFSDTSLSENVVSSFSATTAGFTVDSSSQSTITEMFTITDGFYNFTHSTSDTTSRATTTSPIDTNLDSITTLSINTEETYSPYRSFKAESVCEGDTWDSVYTVSTTSVSTSNTTLVNGTEIGSEQPQTTETTTTRSEKYIVEAVNVPYTVTAGTFNTVRYSLEDTNFKVTTWIDIDSGATVFNRIEDFSDPDNITTLEVTEISRGNPIN